MQLTFSARKKAPIAIVRPLSVRRRIGMTKQLRGGGAAARPPHVAMTTSRKLGALSWVYLGLNRNDDAIKIAEKNARDTAAR